jgi:hypothetical protein
MRWQSGRRLAGGLGGLGVLVVGAVAAVAAQQAPATKLAGAAVFAALPRWLLVIHSAVSAAPPVRPPRRSAPG